MSISRISSAIRDVKDFPKKGIIFKDITPVLQSGKLFAEVVDLFHAQYKKSPPDYVVAIESRGFIFGSALAYKFGCGIVPVRKKGKLPYRTISESYELEYGTATIEIHEDALGRGDRVVLVDDLLATGGTACAAVKLIESLGAEVMGISFLVELGFLKGRERLEGRKINSLILVP